jgi:hypothetical protein
MSLGLGVLLPKTLDIDLAKCSFLSTKNTVLYTDSLDYLRAKHDYKIAVLDENIRQSKKTVDFYLTNSDRVIVHNMELDQLDTDYIKSQKDKKQLIFSINGIINDQNVNTFVSLEWFTATSYVNRELLPNRLKQLNPHEPKEFDFDYLPGIPKPHRLYVSNLIDHHGLNQRIFTTKYFRDNKTTIDYSDTASWDVGLVGIDSGYNHVNYQGVTTRSSQIVPINIYNRSSYSIIAETWCSNDFSFYTEKLIKPMLALRLFVVFAGQYYLRGLRQLGFKTFDGIIDESYDNIADTTTRWNCAFDQVIWLCGQPQEEILKKIIPIVVHNYRQLIGYEWQDNFRNRIEDLYINLLQENK